MNCTNCNKPVEANARFCPNCGATVSRSPNPGTASPIPSHQPASMGEPPTLPPANQKNEPLVLRPAYQPDLQNQRAAQHQPEPLAAPSQPQSSYYAQSTSASTGMKTNASYGETRPRRRGKGCLGLLITLVVLLVLIGGGWFLVLRPYLNNMATNKLDSVLTDATNKIPSQVSLAPAGPVTISENVLNNLLTLASSPDDLVKNTQIHITPAAMSLQFQVFGFACTVTGVPKVVQGKLVATNVTVDGIAGLIFSPDEITALANRHFAEVQTKIQHTFTSVQLNNQQIIVVLGASSTSPVPSSSPIPGNGTPFPIGSPPTIP
ncbi:MAG TPA: zinc-ribbon domain-containing protein [Ktedonobacteraceae bacterium]|nr:zinc-ribbon domain-containing protein [Ktedonobacteraceae bacterium]